jgi:archaemetzincin
MNRLYVMPVGNVDEHALEVLKERFQQELGWDVRTGPCIVVPGIAYDAKRKQYEAIHILRAVIDGMPGDASRVLAVADADLFIPMLTFVFGQAQLSGKAALMSLARLRQEYYGLPANTALLYKRAEKEAMHEVGHTFGLIHCTDKDCVMALSNSIQQVDGKFAEYCRSCAILLQDSLTRVTTDKQRERQ